MKKLLIGLVVVLLSGCAATPEEVEAYKQRYVFNDISTVNSITRFQLDSWEALDDYALVVNMEDGNTYLLILTTFLPEVNRSIELLVTSAEGEVRAGRDTVRTRRQPYMRSTIQTIYPITEDQVPAIASRIRNFDPNSVPAPAQVRAAVVPAPPPMPAAPQAREMPQQAEAVAAPAAPVAPAAAVTPEMEEEDAVEEDDGPGFFERMRERMGEFGSQPDEPVRPRR